MLMVANLVLEHIYDPLLALTVVVDIENNHRLRRNNLRLPIQREHIPLSGSFISYYSKSIFYLFYNNSVSNEVVGSSELIQKGEGGVKWYIVTSFYIYETHTYYFLYSFQLLLHCRFAGTIRAIKSRYSRNYQR